MKHKTRINLFRIKGKIRIYFNRFISLLPAIFFVPLAFAILLSPIAMLVITGKFYWLFGLLVSWFPVTVIITWASIMKKIFR
jgi:hypothetical protein